MNILRKKSLGIVLLLIGMETALAQQPYQVLWIDSQTNTHVESAIVTPQSLGLAGSWSIEKQVLFGGKQDGVDVVLVNNGKMKILLVPTRGMSIWSVECGDVRLGWDSPVGQIVHPKYVNLEARNGLGWLDGFGGWLVRCGLEFAGAPGVDKITSNTGSIIEVPLTLHGKVDYTPASRVEISIDSQPPYILRVRGVVHECSMFGPNLQLTTELATVPDSLEFTVNDVIANMGGHDSEMMLIQHLNFGPPLLEEGAQFVAAVERVTPRDERAAEAKPEEIFVYGPPKTGFVEQVYYLKPLADEKGMVEAMLRNKKGDRAACLRYAVKELPCLTLWKNTTALKDGCATGVEPGVNYSNNRSLERKYKRVPVLKPGDSRFFSLQFEIAMSGERVEAVEKKIRGLQKQTKIAFDPKPVEGISY